MLYYKCKLTVSAIVIHQNNFLQQVLWSVGDNTSYSPFNDRKSLVHIDQYHADGWQVFGIILRQTSKWCEIKNVVNVLVSLVSK